MTDRNRVKVAAVRRRKTAAQVREAMLKAGQASAWRAGLTLELNDSHFDDLIREAGVPRSSVFRIWPTKADFMVDLFEILSAQRDTDMAFNTRIGERIASLTHDNAELLTTSAGRRAVLLETVRRVVDEDIATAAQSIRWQSQMQLALATPVLSELPGGERIVDAQISATYRDEIAAAAASVAEAARGIFRLRLKPAMPSLEHFVIATAGVLEGYALRALVSTATGGTREESVAGRALTAMLAETVEGPALGGGTTRWSPAAVAYLALVDAYFEPVDD